MKSYNGKSQNLRRLYDSIRNFTLENDVHSAGDVLCISTHNNDYYDLFLTADGKSTFRELYAKGTGRNIYVIEEDEGQTVRIKIE